VAQGQQGRGFGDRILTSLTPGITVVTGNATYGAIAPQATVNGTTFKIQVPSSATCGQALQFNVQTTSSLGTTTTSFTLRVGTPAGTGAPITYTRTIPVVWRYPTTTSMASPIR